MAKTKVIKKGSNADILKYITNQIPELREEIKDIPMQGDGISKIGDIIMSNNRYKNAFINTINVIGETVIKKNFWDNPWEFTTRGTLKRGMTVRELIVDLVEGFGYNKNFDNNTKFLENRVPDVLQQLHNINFQMIYPITTADDVMNMAFEREGGLLDMIENIVAMPYESAKYDIYQIDKYMLGRAILNGFVASRVVDLENQYAREIVSDMIATSDDITFRSPEYNPAGLYRACELSNQIMILNTKFKAKLQAEVLATSYFREEVTKGLAPQLTKVDGFGNIDNNRLSAINDEIDFGFVPYTEDEIATLNSIPAVIISREWFMDYNYELTIGTYDEVASMIGKTTEFYNPTTYKNNLFFGVWRVFSFSPFESAICIVGDKGSVVSVTLSPDTVTISPSIEVKLTPIVEVKGVANKAVTYESSDDTIATVDVNGVVRGISAGEVTITATSVYDGTTQGTATVIVA